MVRGRSGSFGAPAGQPSEAAPVPVRAISS